MTHPLQHPYTHARNAADALRGLLLVGTWEALPPDTEHAIVTAHLTDLAIALRLDCGVRRRVTDVRLRQQALRLAAAIEAVIGNGHG